MKQLLYLVVTTLLTINSYAQVPPSAAGNGGINNGNFWSRAGNNQANGNNIMGTRWNSPMYFITGGLTQQTYRMKLNGDFGVPAVPQYPINGYGAANGVNTSGYLGLGFNLNGIWSQNSNPAGAAGPYSLLHLNGRDGTSLQTFGYRPWMKTGITLTDNNDLSYIGLRKLGNGTDVTETTIAWADNQGGSSGPDDMCFRFTGGGGQTISNNLNSAVDLDGLHIARFTGYGHFGLGNTFGENTGGPAGLYIRPKSLLHLSHTWNAQEREWGFMQITYRNQTGETENDGLRMGVDRQFNTFNGYMRWQENTPFIVQTDWNNGAGGIRNGERMRIASINAPGVPNPLNAPSNNVTRVAISHLGDDPITSPRSLLHLGYDTGTDLLPVNDGWRNWMDVGTFTNRASDNMYVGLKEEGTDRFDAVINWGDNQVPGVSPNGPDYLRFIFTSTNSALTGQGDPVSQSNEGLEIARMHPGLASTLPNTNYGMVGIGNFSANNPNAPAPIDAKLDIDGDLRIREVTQNNNLNRVLVIDPADENRVHYADINLPTGGNGFTDCADNTGAANLTTDSKVNLNNQQLFFENNDVFGQNHTGFGYDCGSVLPAKVSVEQVHPAVVPESSTAISGINSDVTSGFLKTYTGVYGQATELQNINLRPIMIGGDFTAANGALNYGVRSTMTNSAQTSESNFGFYSMIDDNNSAINYGSFNVARNSAQNVGVHGQANAFIQSSPATLGFGGRFISWSHNLQNVGVEGNTASVSAYGFQNFGVAGVAGSATNNYSIYGEVPVNSPGTNFYAGYFTGNVVFTGGAVLVSDSTYKENITPLDDVADSLLMLVKPYSYEYQQTGNAERLRLDTGTKFGVLAQQIEPYFPHMVKEVTHPAKLDSLGNIVDPSFQYKAVDITQLIPVMLFDTQKKNEIIEGQSNEIDSLANQLDQTVAELTDVNDRLTQLENCLSGILPFLCQLSNTAIEQNDIDVQNELIKTIQVELSNKDNVVLNQNVPNPFAESTVITFSIPESVQKAQIHFYDGTGKLINSVDIEERGAGRLNVFGNDLSKGVYTYSLVADGQIVSTKRMMKQ